MITMLTGDCRNLLRTLADASVHCVVTSPPYWGLRDYGHVGQLGLEPDFNAYVAAMVAVFREVRRVLRDDGTLWLNMGDSYATSVNGRSAEDTRKALANTPDKYGHVNPWKYAGKGSDKPFSTVGGVLKPKDLCGIPWRVAFALQADGWYLRQDIIWSKPNPMPESVTDRCTKAHEYLFLLSKRERYYYDHIAIQEPFAYSGDIRMKTAYAEETGKEVGSEYRSSVNQLGRNKRSVWEVTTQPFSEAHFATFPPALIEPCIRAGCPVGGTVLDPFGGAGTTGLVADRLQRNAVLIELNPAYAAMGERRIVGDSPLFVEIKNAADYNPEDDFAKSIDEAYRVIRERKANGGEGWEPP